MQISGRARWRLGAFVAASVGALTFFHCGSDGSTSDPPEGGGPSGGAAAGRSTSEFVGTWRTGVVHQLSGTCYPQELKDQLPAVDYELLRRDATHLTLKAYDAQLSVDESSARLTGSAVFDATNPNTGTLLTSRLSAWSLTLGSPSLIEHSGTIETKSSSGAVETCTHSLIVEASRLE
jgi:hypothetical protein